MILSHLPGPVYNPAPGHAQLPVIKFLHRDNFPPSIKHVPRCCASAHLPTSSTGTISRPLIKLVPRPRQHPIKFVPWRQKARHTWLATGTTLWPRWRGVPGPVAGWLRQVTQPPFIAGPLAHIFQNVRLSLRAALIKFYLDNRNSALLSGPAIARQTICPPAVSRKICY